MPCEDSCTCPEHVAARFRLACERIRADISGRTIMCQKIAVHARKFHLDVTPERVDRHYDWFLRWYHGGIATGYLINRTGIKRMASARR
jgi:hypothetical protein